MFCLSQFGSLKYQTTLGDNPRPEDWELPIQSSWPVPASAHSSGMRGDDGEIVSQLPGRFDFVLSGSGFQVIRERWAECHHQNGEFVCAWPRCSARFLSLYLWNVHRGKHECVFRCPIVQCASSAQPFESAGAAGVHVRDVHGYRFYCSDEECKMSQEQNFKGYTCSTGLDYHNKNRHSGMEKFPQRCTMEAKAPRVWSRDQTNPAGRPSLVPQSLASVTPLAVKRANHVPELSPCPTKSSVPSDSSDSVREVSDARSGVLEFEPDQHTICFPSRHTDNGHISDHSSASLPGCAPVAAGVIAAASAPIPPAPISSEPWVLPGAVLRAYCPNGPVLEQMLPSHSQLSTLEPTIVQLNDTINPSTSFQRLIHVLADVASDVDSDGATDE